MRVIGLLWLLAYGIELVAAIATVMLAIVLAGIGRYGRWKTECAFPRARVINGGKL